MLIALTFIGAPSVVGMTFGKVFDEATAIKSQVLGEATRWAINVVLSMVMGVATERSGAILIAVTLHAWFNLAFELPIWQTYVTLGVGLIAPRWGRRRWPQAPSAAPGTP